MSNLVASVYAYKRILQQLKMIHKETSITTNFIINMKHILILLFIFTIMEMSVAHFPFYRTSYGAPLILDHPSYYQQQQQQQPEPYTNYGGYFYPRNPNEKEYTGYFGRTNVYGVESDNLNTRFGNEYLRQADDYYQHPQYFYRNDYVAPSSPPALPVQPPVVHYYNSPSLLESQVYQYQNVNPPRRYIINQDHYKSPMTFPHTGYERPQEKSTEKPSTHDVGINADCTLGKTKLQDQTQLLKNDDKNEMTTTIAPMSTTTTVSITTIKPDAEISSEKNEESITEEIKTGDDDDDDSTEKVTEISTETISTTETIENQQEQESIEE